MNIYFKLTNTPERKRVYYVNDIYIGTTNNRGLKPKFESEPELNQMYSDLILVSKQHIMKTFKKVDLNFEILKKKFGVLWDLEDNEKVEHGWIEMFTFHANVKKLVGDQLANFIYSKQLSFKEGETMFLKPFVWKDLKDLPFEAWNLASYGINNLIRSIILDPEAKQVFEGLVLNEQF